jgi:hypothetical protein
MFDGSGLNTALLIDRTTASFINAAIIEILVSINRGIMLFQCRPQKLKTKRGICYSCSALENVGTRQHLGLNTSAYFIETG